MFFSTFFFYKSICGEYMTNKWLSFSNYIFIKLEFFKATSILMRYTCLIILGYIVILLHLCSLSQDLKTKIDQACRTAEEFTRLYYETLDKRRYVSNNNAVKHIPWLYASTVYAISADFKTVHGFCVSDMERKWSSRQREYKKVLDRSAIIRT